MQDIFQNQTTNEFIDNIISEGNYERVPRGVLSIEDIQIAESDLTSKFARGYYTKINDGNINSYSARLNVIPLTFSMTIELKYDTGINGWKLIESFWKTFFRIKSVKFMSNGLVYGAYIGFPVSLDDNKTTEFSFGTEMDKKLNIPLEVATYYIIIDEETEMALEKKILSINLNLDPDVVFDYDIDSGMFGDYVDTSRNQGLITSNVTGEQLGTSGSSGTAGITITGNESKVNIQAEYELGSKELMSVEDTLNVDDNIHHLDRFGYPTKKVDPLDVSLKRD